MPSLIYSDKIKARHFNSTKHFIDHLYAINEGRNLEYPKELEVNFEDQGDDAKFLNFDITIKEGTFYI